MKCKLSEYWDEKYSEVDVEKLGWYEKKSEPSLSLIQNCDIKLEDKILDVGSGASTLIDDLVTLGYKNIVVTDISKKSLAITKKRLGEKSANINFLVDDITKSVTVKRLKNISIWHDRATLHFFTKEDDRNAYLVLLKSVLKKDGFVIISTFALNGLTTCSGLSVKPYSAQMLLEFFGSDFKLIKSLEYTYSTSWGQERPFIYAIFQRIRIE